MDHDGRNVLAIGGRLFFFALAFNLIAAARAHAVSNATTECLIGFAGVPDANKDGGMLSCTDCDPTCDGDGVTTPNQSCTIDLKLCANRAEGSCTGTALKRVQVKGKCQGTTTLKFSPSGDAVSCGPMSGIVVKLKKKGTRPGKCKIVAMTLSTGKPRKVDKDVLTLICNPRASGESCPTTTTTTTVAVTTTSTLVCPPPVPTGTPTCAPIVVGQPIPGTYQLQGTVGDKRCTTNAASNRFGACSTDADCGNTAGSCLQLPWVTADGQIMPFPTGVQTTFTVNAEDTFPRCEHSTCIPCGNPSASCTGIPGCEVSGNPNGCIPRATQGCCDQPGFVVPTFFVNILGGLCSRVDQIACGLGVINTSNPQTGDNEVTKNGDTSDPGADCCYNNDPNAADCIGGVNNHDDPAPLACTVAQAGDDYKGKIVSAIGNGSADDNGIQYRLTTPELSTTWTDGQSPPGTCADGSTYDDGERLVSQLILQAQPTTAGATGSFVDMNGDGCKRAGTGFISAGNPATDGPITVGPASAGGPLKPQPYDGSAGSVSAAVSEVFSGPNSPIRDIGFVAITPQMPIISVTPRACCCSPTPGCPE